MGFCVNRAILTRGILKPQNDMKRLASFILVEMYLNV